VSPSVSVSVSMSGVNVSPHLHHAYCVISARMAAPASSMRSFNGAPRLGKLVHVFLCCVVSVAPYFDACGAWCVCASYSLLRGKCRAPYFDACELDMLRLSVPRHDTPDTRQTPKFTDKITKQRLTPNRNKHTDRDTDIKLLFMFSTL
jgi:hypothetical protein